MKRHLLLRGPAKIGKTTLIQQLASLLEKAKHGQKVGLPLGAEYAGIYVQSLLHPITATATATAQVDEIVNTHICIGYEAFGVRSKTKATLAHAKWFPRQDTVLKVARFGVLTHEFDALLDKELEVLRNENDKTNKVIFVFDEIRRMETSSQHACQWLTDIFQDPRILVVATVSDSGGGIITRLQRQVMDTKILNVTKSNRNALLQSHIVPWIRHSFKTQTNVEQQHQQQEKEEQTRTREVYPV